MTSKTQRWRLDFNKWRQLFFFEKTLMLAPLRNRQLGIGEWKLTFVFILINTNSVASRVQWHEFIPKYFCFFSSLFIYVYFISSSTIKMTLLYNTNTRTDSFFNGFHFISIYYFTFYRQIH